MRPREVAIALAAVAVLATGCSRLTFVKPSAQRKSAERVAPEYRFRETEAGKRRMEMRRHVAAADRALREGQLDVAWTESQAALKAAPDQAEPHSMVALVASARGEAELAGRHYAEAARLAPSGSTLNNHGAWLCGNGRAAESLRWFDGALADPNYGDQAGALANAGTCAAMAGEHERAERDLRAALALEPENTVALSAMAERQFALGRYLEARAFSERRLAAAPATAQALELASRIEEKLGDSVAATRYVQRLRTEFPQAGNAIPGGNAQP